MFEGVLIFTFVIFPIVLLLAYISEYILIRKFDYPFKPVVRVIGFIGVIVHELCHVCMCIVNRLPMEKISLSYKDKKTGQPRPHGSVSLKPPLRGSFLQHFLVGFAPLLICAWLIAFSFEIVRSTTYNPLIRIIATIFVVSLFLGLYPSRADMSHVKFGFHNNPRHSWCQLFLLFCSFGSVWYLVERFQIYLPYEFLYYFIIAVAYFIIKYSILAISSLYYYIAHRDFSKRRVLHFRRFTRFSHKPKKPHKSGQDRAQW